MTDEPDETEDWPDPLADEYELRVTRRALEDLGADNCFGSELDEIARVSDYSDIVSKFAKMRSVDPRGTESPLSKVHRGDIYKLDGRDGQRAVTWHDKAYGVVWLLGFTPEHDYDLFVDRAAQPERRGLGGPNQLMPSADDYQDLLDERDADELVRVEAALAALVRQAAEVPGSTVRGELAVAVRAEAHVVHQGAERRLHLRFRTPPLRAGVLPPHFDFYLAATVPDVDASTVSHMPYPGAPVRGALVVSALLTT